MHFSKEQIDALERELNTCSAKYAKTLTGLSDIHSRLKRDKAKEYLLFGVSRRLSILFRCIHNVFEIYPPARMKVLSVDEMIEVCINLHAFFVNLFGIYDNLAWVLVFEKHPEKEKNKFNATLYKKKKMAKGTEAEVEDFIANEAILSKALKTYLNEDRMNYWYKEHLKEYRDALAHRIPLYVPPGKTTENNADIAVPFFAGSISDETLVIMHSQLLANFNTVIELISKFSEFEFPKKTASIGGAKVAH